MASKASTTSRSDKKGFRSIIEQRLEQALIEWKEELGEKKFRKRIKKAGKLFGKDLKRSSRPKAKKNVITDKKKKPVTQ